MKTYCGHDITVRCLRCAADYDPVQPRRWSKLCKRSKALTERKIKPDEARTATMAVLVQLGVRLDQVREFDAKCDEFRLLVRDADGVQKDCRIAAELVADACPASAWDTSIAPTVADVAGTDPASCFAAWAAPATEDSASTIPASSCGVPPLAVALKASTSMA